jgi:hypothetical protein
MPVRIYEEIPNSFARIPRLLKILKKIHFFRELAIILYGTLSKLRASGKELRT